MSIASRTACCIVFACLLSAWSPRASALDPVLDASQYGHTAWRVREGFSRGSITSFAQTPDGYLWLGTTSGLLRFDGVRTVPWQPPVGSSLPDDHVRAMLAARDGTLWIGTLRGLASWSGGKLVTYPRFNDLFVNGLVEDRDDTVWVSAASPGHGLLCSIRLGKPECAGEDGGLEAHVTSLYEDSNGALWAAGADRVWRWKPGPPQAYPVPGGMVGSLQDVSEAATRTVLLLTRDGIRQIVGNRIEPFPLASMPRSARPTRVLRDRDGALWLGTLDGGLLHVHQGHTDVFGRADGLSGDTVWRLFEDREGSIWVATNEGLDRFRALAAVTYSAGQGLPAGNASLLAARDGTVWVSTTAGLKRWSDGRLEQANVRGLPQMRAASLFQDSRGRIWIGSHTGVGFVENEAFAYIAGVPGGFIDSFAEDKHGNLWIAHRDAGLLRLSRDGGVEQISWNRIGGRPARRMAVDPVHGGLWLGYLSGGVIHLVDGRIAAEYSVRDGLGRGAVNHVSVADDGALWVATEGGLSRITAGRIATLNSRNGLPCDAVDSTIEGDDGAWWLYTACAVVRVARAELDAWAAAVDNGQAPRRIDATVLDSSDGVRSTQSIGGSYSPHVVKSRDGKLWFTTFDGVTVVDPRHLRFNELPPPVHVEQVVADRRAYPAPSQLRLPPLTRDLEIQYTATSLAVPEKVQFRYKLEGRDRDWKEAGNRRQAFYSDLDPGKYRFRVIASNNSGVWNEQGAELDFSVAPAYWQTDWFRALCVAALILLLLAAYRLRVHQLQRTFSMTLDARVNERMRIARELHDTLLQSFQSLLPSLQSVFHLLPSRPADAKAIVGSMIDEAAEAITEGRDAVQGLRASVRESNDLAEALRALGEELAAEKSAGHPPVLAVEVQGLSRPLRPIVRDEIFRVASEALRNAFAHAAATQIDVELRYDERQFRLRVRDDGKGLDSTVLRDGGREGHFGMPGMRERAEVIRGKLTVWSAAGSGTEVELVVPAANAYEGSPSSGRLSRFAQKLRRQTAPSHP